MPQTQTAPYLDELVRALGEKVGSETTVAELEVELNRYLEYGVPAEQARTIILKKFGVTPKGGSGVRRTLAELGGDEKSVNLLVRIVHIQPREVTVKGEKRQITSGILGDESRTAPFTSWKPIDYQKGDVLKVSGAYTREFRGEIQVNFGDRVLIEKTDPTLLPPPPQGGASMGGASGPLKCAELRPGDSNVELTARVLDVQSKEVQVQGNPKTVFSGILADATGKVQFNAWHDHGLTTGEVVTIKGGYVKTWRDTPQFTFDEKALVERLPTTALPAIEELENQGPVPLSTLYQGGGQMDVTVEATLLDVRPGSGLIQRCTQCKKVLLNDACREHGKNEGRPDLRVKAILDDGTAAINCILGRELTEAMVGKSLDDCIAMAKDAATPDVVSAEVKAKLLARTVRVRGNVLVDEFGPMLLAKDAAFVQRDLAAAAEALLAELEGVA